MSDPVLTISATEFKAKCLRIFDQLESQAIQRVVVTRRGKPVAELTTPKPKQIPTIWGCMKGTVHIPPGVDITEPAHDEPWDAELGILLR